MHFVNTLLLGEGVLANVVASPHFHHLLSYWVWEEDNRDGDVFFYFITSIQSSMISKWYISEPCFLLGQIRTRSRTDIFSSTALCIWKMFWLIRSGDKSSADPEIVFNSKSSRNLNYARIKPVIYILHGDVYLLLTVSLSPLLLLSDKAKAQLNSSVREGAQGTACRRR